ncbi:MAG TPA: hypothetical protein VNL13_05645 [Sulfolobales archaeon]|nr:hypothetical protein [Sulfolobales archaeon]
MRSIAIVVLLAAVSIAILIPSMAVAQAMWGGWGFMMNTAYNGYSKAASSYGGMMGGMGNMGGMMGIGTWSGYMGRMVGMGGMMGTNYTEITVSGIFLVNKDIEDMEHMAILDSGRNRYALILPSEEWVLRSPNGSITRIDLEELRETLNATRVTIKGIYIGSMEDMMSRMMGMMHGMGGMMGGYGAPMCHSTQTMGIRSTGMPMMPMGMYGMGGMGGMMGGGMHGNSDEQDEEDHDHMEACMIMMTLPHVVVTEIKFNGYTATPYE